MKSLTHRVDGMKAESNKVGDGTETPVQTTEVEAGEMTHEVETAIRSRSLLRPPNQPVAGAMSLQLLFIPILTLTLLILNSRRHRLQSPSLTSPVACSWVSSGTKPPRTTLPKASPTTLPSPISTS